ncbi:hypothetical protein ADUPG1_010994 [Aduncisulcus paluster]|uniref:EF-hand domain-containing protein n=1 Tax=Aduncisulcus paluster TaxID=2918883 RepID=A0ABQ5JTQ3_9EUKA|nr:hypothetical protein ADUPG1_010994 [Aduncisulcus paluster]|eukprot:gnl/Carplike_NY0171/390_a538_3223.p1 GENE.gnl/Carplike_NY0171/390_a538_3223~~gnl/Carplike_NY0171/390_a538_3223.p1  ORF type:complete len:409 (+),score=128.48 gnl/Carplike_NY0171/390_a538_3223:57-1283(+)
MPCCSSERKLPNEMVADLMARSFFKKKELTALYQLFIDLYHSSKGGSSLVSEPFSLMAYDDGRCRVPSIAVSSLPEFVHNPFIERLCRIFSDHKSDNSLSFLNFVMLATVLSDAAHPLVKEQVAFRVYDSDNDGYINEMDIENLVVALVVPKPKLVAAMNAVVKHYMIEVGKKTQMEKITKSLTTAVMSGKKLFKDPRTGDIFVMEAPRMQVPPGYPAGYAPGAPYRGGPMPQPGMAPGIPMQAGRAPPPIQSPPSGSTGDDEYYSEYYSELSESTDDKKEEKAAQAAKIASLIMGSAAKGMNKHAIGVKEAKAPKKDKKKKGKKGKKKEEDILRDFVGMKLEDRLTKRGRLLLADQGLSEDDITEIKEAVMEEAAQFAAEGKIGFEEFRRMIARNSDFYIHFTINLV